MKPKHAMLVTCSCLLSRGSFAFLSPKNIIFSKNMPPSASHRKFSMLKMVGEDIKTPLKPISNGDSSPSENMESAARYAEEARVLMLEAERLRLEAEKEKLQMDREKLEKKMAILAKHDALIDIFRESFSSGGKEALVENVKSRLSDVSATLFLRMYDLAEGADSLDERASMVELSEAVMSTVEKYDLNLAVKINSDVSESLRRAASSGSFVNITPLKAEMEIPLNLKPQGLIAMEINGLPLRVPPSLRRYMKNAPSISEEDVETLKKQVFGLDTFYVTSTESDPGSVLFRGNLRGQDSQIAFSKVLERLQEQPGLRDRVQLLLMPDYMPPKMDDVSSAYEINTNPIILAISSSVKPESPTALTYVLSLITLVVTVFSMFIYALGTYALNVEFLNHMNQGDYEFAYNALPIVGGVFVLQLVHEIAHRITAAFSDKNLLGPPLFLPSLQVGTFGTITPFKSFPKDRKQVFDISIAGPVAGFIASLMVLIGGLILTNGATLEALSGFPVVPAGFFHSSGTVGIAASFLLPSAMLQPLSVSVPIHPLAAIGFTGIIINALNLLPIGRLDGGRASCAVFGRRSAAVISTLTLIAQASSALFNNYTIQLFWGLLVIILQRNQDLPALDEVSEVGAQRRNTLLILFAFALLTLLPYPGS